MTPEHPILAVPLDLAANISAGHFVKADGALAGAGDVALGVLYMTAKSGELGTVRVLGLVPVVAGGAIAAGADIQSNAAGRAVAYDGTGAILGRALSAAAADGDEFQAFLPGHTPPAVRVPITLAAAIAAGYFVDFDGTLPANGAAAVGPLVEGGDSGDTVMAAVGGVANVVIGAAVAVGAPIQTNAAGKAITRTGSNVIQGRALSAGAADGDVIRMIVSAN